MRLSTIRTTAGECAAIVTKAGLAPLWAVNQAFGQNWATTLYALICEDQLDHLNDWYRSGGKEKLASLGNQLIPEDQASYAPLYRDPKKIFGIGLNYADHASDLAEKTPQGYPASFYKPATSIIGHGDAVQLPLISQKTTGEAELGVILGRGCENIQPEQWLDYVAGFTTIIDMTAEDILRQNPRYLTLVKGFATFFSFGPELVTKDEIPDVKQLLVQTVKNGLVHAENRVANMTFPPDFLVAFHSQVFRWQPGDILSTGTPRAVELHHGDQVECRISGFKPLANPVVDKKILAAGTK